MKTTLYVAFFLLGGALLVGSTEEWVKVDQPECVRYMGYRQSSLSNIALRFYNGCGRKVNLNVCVELSKGKFELQKSARALPVNGSAEFYYYFGEKPRSIQWASSMGIPPIPGQCG